MSGVEPKLWETPKADFRINTKMSKKYTIIFLVIKERDKTRKARGKEKGKEGV